MADLFIHKITHVILVLFTICLNNVLADYSNYVRHILEEDLICPPFPKSAKTLKSSELATLVYPSYRFITWKSIPQDLVCNFTIKAPAKKHLMAVIQNMSFRYNENKCIDYIQFKGKRELESDKLCRPEDVFKGTESSWGEIETTIFVSNEQLKSSDSPINITIVYTPFVPSHHQDCYYKNSNRKLSNCIADRYYCDGFKNCLKSVCDDEKDCVRKFSTSDTGTKVTIAAVTTIFLCFIVFILSLWICRRYKKLCWSSDCAGPRPDDDRFRTNPNESNPVNQSIASAPILEVSVLSSSADKDLPPSYDSLFPPNQSNNST